MGRVYTRIPVPEVSHGAMLTLSRVGGPGTGRSSGPARFCTHAAHRPRSLRAYRPVPADTEAALDSVAMPTRTSGAPSATAEHRAGPGWFGWFTDEIAALVLPVVLPVVRRLPTVVLGLCVLLTTISVFALVGALRDDAAIAARPVVVTAEVLPDSSWSRTLIRFTTQDGKLLVPEKGVYYPRGLTPGQVIRVEYDRDHPDRVRVYGRDASVGYLPVAGIVLGLWATLGPLWWWLRRRRAASPA